MKATTVGRDSACDLVLDHPTISRTHARIELGDDGHVSILDADSSNGVFLNRNATWIRIKRVSLCIGDRIRFGEYDIALEQITAVFGRRARVKLHAKQFFLRHGKAGSRGQVDFPDPGQPMKKPRRNPQTGRVEDDLA